MERVKDLRGQLRRGTDQLRGVDYSRMIFTADVPAEGEESTTLVESIRETAEHYYGEGKVLVVGEITSARDLADSYTGDSRRKTSAPCRSRDSTSRRSYGWYSFSRSSTTAPSSPPSRERRTGS